MKMFIKFFVIVVFVVFVLFFFGVVFVQEVLDVLVKCISLEVLDIVRNDKDIQFGNNICIMQLVEQKILFYVDFECMIQLVVGCYWCQVILEQQKQLIIQFCSLLVFIYFGVLLQVCDQKIEFKLLCVVLIDIEVEVNLQVIFLCGGELIQLSYCLEKKFDGWKLYDVNVLGVWLVEVYCGIFFNEISKGGIDGLIKVLIDKNQQLVVCGNGKK